MNKAEREELRRLLRAQFKVLKSDVEHREAELQAELEAAITARFAAQDKAWSDAMFLIDEAAREANRKANDILRGLEMEGYDASKEWEVVVARSIAKPSQERARMRRQGAADIEVKVRSALLELQRREVELLAELATSALESADAKAFIGRIPTVSELVPASRLLAIEAEFNGGAEG